MSRKERFNERNIYVRQQYSKLTKDNPKWRIDAIIDEVAKKTFLASRTVEAIISHEGIYNEKHQTAKNNGQLNIF